MILETITDSGLRGRGGAGFPTAKKWLAVQFLMTNYKNPPWNSLVPSSTDERPMVIRQSYGLRDVESLGRTTSKRRK